MLITDIIVFIVYFSAMLAVGFYFMRKNKSPDDYYVGGRNMGSAHVGLSVVATDVGGGFSIGLGGLGFLMGVSGSWMLFTGLIGAWLSAVFLIPRVSKLAKETNLFTFPELFKKFYSPETALIAGIISAIGYIGFSSSQLLAGAKLAAASFDDLSKQTALLIMGIIAVGYTVIGGLKAVIYTDTVQWMILMAGLIFVGIPITYTAVGGYEAIVNSLPEEFLEFSNLKWQDAVNWAITIIPIWFVGMTLYQRIYACRGEKEAKRAWYIAGVLEWPIMAFMGVVLGLFSRVALLNDMLPGYEAVSIDGFDSEMGLPLLLRHTLPVGFMGLMMAAYFSAIMSTADSCLMAASGNVVTDILEKLFPGLIDQKNHLRWSQITTLIIGVFALLLASVMPRVLDLMLYSYAFMVSGLFIPLMAGIFFGNRNYFAAIATMIVGGTTTILLIVLDVDLPFNLDPNIFWNHCSHIHIYNT